MKNSDASDCDSLENADGTEYNYAVYLAVMGRLGMELGAPV
jgi:hypothetical protein